MTRENPKSVSFSAIPLRQPVGEFFIGVMSYSDLVRISIAHVRRLEIGKDEFYGIQRELSKKRRKELAKYVNTVDATFPTAVILAISDECAAYEPRSGIMTLVPTENYEFSEIAEIIDGQHRIDGLRRYEGPDFDINIAVFLGADEATQAYLFATVNLAQTKVNKSLVYDLYSLESNRSPQKSCHHIAVALDKHPESPLHKRIKRLGTADPNKKTALLTQATVVESLLPFITDDAIEDRDSFLRGIVRRPLPSSLANKVIFRRMYEKEKEAEITKILINYFSAVSERWPVAWADVKKPANVLPRTNGFRALMRFLRPSYLKIVGERKDVVPTIKQFSKVLDPIPIKESEFNTTNFQPGTSGEAALYKLLSSYLFTPPTP